MAGLHAVGWVLACALQPGTAEPQSPPPVVLRHEDPPFEIPLPPGYEETQTPPPTAQYGYQRRVRGDEKFITVVVQILPGPWRRTERSPAEIEHLERHAGSSLPPGSTVRLGTGYWMNREIDVFEYRFTVGGLEVFGLMAQLPLEPRGIQLSLGATGVEDDVARKEFDIILGSVKGQTREPTRTQAFLSRTAGVTIVGGTVLLLFDILGTALCFRRNPMLLRRTRLVALGLAVVASLVGTALLYPLIRWRDGALLVPFLCALLATFRWIRVLRTTAPESAPEADRKLGQKEIINLAFIAALAIGSGFVTYLWPESPLGWVWLNIAVSYGFVLILLFPAAIAKALAARLVGFRRLTLTLGVGPLVWKGDRADLRAIPIGGAFVGGPLSPSYLRSRLLLISLTGVLANGAILLVVAFLARASFTGLEDLTHRVSPFQDLAFATAWMLLTELAARKLLVPSPNRFYDRISLLQALSLPVEGRRSMAALTHALEASLCMQEDRPGEAISWLDRGLALEPGLDILRHDRAVALLMAGRLDEAKPEFLRLAGETSLQPGLRGFALSNIATIDLQHPSRTALLEEADRSSEEALRLSGDEPAVRSTRGAVLVELGRLEEGTTLLRATLENAPRPSMRAQCLIYLGLALHLQGKAEEARSLFEKARTAHPKSPYLARVAGL